MNLIAALSMHSAGNLAGAEQGYREVLAQDSASHVALEKLGLICLTTGRVAEGMEMLRSALKGDPNNPDIYLNLGAAHRGLGQLDESLACYQKGLDLGAKYPEAYLNLGDVLLEKGDFEGAVSWYRKAQKLRPGFPEAYNNMGVAFLKLGNLDEARLCLNKATQYRPNYAQAQHNLGVVLQQQSKWQDAATAFGAALKTWPNQESYLNLGAVLFESYYTTGSDKALQDAISAYQAALTLNQNYPEALSNLGLALHEKCRYDEAVGAYRRALAVKPSDSATYLNMGLALGKQYKYDDMISSYQKALQLMCEKLPADSPVSKLGRLLLELHRLPVIYSDVAGIEKHRVAYIDTLTQASAMLADLGRSFDENELNVLRGILFRAPNFYLPYQQLVDTQPQAMSADIAMEILKPDFAPFMSVRKTARSDRKIRLGIASGDLRYHHGSYWALGWLANLPADDYEFFLYSLNGKVDDVTRKFAALGTYRWLPFKENNYLDSLKVIQDDELDVLVITDVGMNPANRILSLVRVAPIQCVGWAHPVTCGSKNIDYFLSSDLMESENADSHYTEKLVRLANIGLHLEYPDDVDVEARLVDFGIPEGRTVYGSVQSLFKYLPQHDYVYPEIAKQDPNACFVFISNEDPGVTELFKCRLQACFEQADVGFDDHVWIVPRLSPRQFMQLLTLLDVNLDSIGWTGGFTTMRSLALNCPVVTIAGEFMRGRHSSAMFRMIGLEELVAGSLQEYISLAAKIGRDKALRSELIEKIKTNKHKLFNDLECVKSLDKFLKSTVAARREAEVAVAAH